MPEYKRQCFVMEPTYDNHGDVTGEEPMRLPCDTCGVDRRVVSTHIIEARRDPTEVYRLECDHEAI